MGVGSGEWEWGVGSGEWGVGSGDEVAARCGAVGATALAFFLASSVSDRLCYRVPRFACALLGKRHLLSLT